jgi:hypothetical protein
MASVVYGLCVVASLVCAILLLTAHRRRPQRLFLLSGLCFCGLAVNNLLLYADFIVIGAAVDLAILRNLSAAVSVLLLLVGLIWTHNERD